LGGKWKGNEGFFVGKGGRTSERFRGRGKERAVQVDRDGGGKRELRELVRPRVLCLGTNKKHNLFPLLGSHSKGVKLKIGEHRDI